jgi:hypothetical protein
VGPGRNDGAEVAGARLARVPRVTKGRFFLGGRCPTTTTRASRHTKGRLGGVLLERKPIRPLPPEKPRGDGSHLGAPQAGRSGCVSLRVRARVTMYVRALPGPADASRATSWALGAKGVR